MCAIFYNKWNTKGISCTFKIVCVCVCEKEKQRHSTHTVLNRGGEKEDIYDFRKQKDSLGSTVKFVTHLAKSKKE
jgi:hypothetical protein